jgi:uncharacterized membrane protein YfcA
MDLIIPCLVAFAGSFLTFFSGFGLGTLLLPAFILIVPIQEAVLLTAIVHMLNNVFKIVLVGKHIDWNIALRFAIIAIPAAILGGYCLDIVQEFDTIHAYTFSNEVHEITYVKIILGLLMLFFASVEFIPSWKNIQFPSKLLPIGAVLSGFFGGLSGHQGALRSAFLVRSGLSKEAFIASGVFIAIAIDATRIPYYFYSFQQQNEMGSMNLWAFPTLCAFLGAFIGNKFINKVQITSIKIIVEVLLTIIATLLITGVL